MNSNLTVNFHSTLGLLLLTKPMVGVFSQLKHLYCMRKEVPYGPNKNRKIYCRVQKKGKFNTNAAGRKTNLLYDRL